MKFDLLCEQFKSKVGEARRHQPSGSKVRQAAVALVLRENAGQAELLMIKRAIRPGDHWSGNLAFPGGRWQAEDPDLLHTAVRETHEEVGVPLCKGGRLLGRLETIEARNPLIPKIDVTPFVFAAPAEYNVTGARGEAERLALNHEVAVAFWLPVGFLKSTGASEVYRLVVEGDERTWPAYPSEHGPIWGMTERMLTSFLALIGQ